MTDPSFNENFDAVYTELRRIAAAQMRRERSDHTLSATALLNEAYMRMHRSTPAWSSRGHFFGLVANAMRQILVEHARARNAEKRGGDWRRLTLTSAIPEIESGSTDVPDTVDLLDLDEALTALALRDERQARIVELRYFGGLSIEDTASALQISPATIKREWVTAKLFLKKKLRR